MNYNELQTLTTEWATKRGLIPCNDQTQVYKLMSEFGELADNIIKKEDVKDSLGDMCVIINNIVVSKLLKSDTEFTQQQLDLLYKKPSSMLVDINLAMYNVIQEISRLHLLTIHDHMTFECIKTIYDAMHKIAGIFNLSLDECWEHAYNEIKNRTGKTNELGNFIKD